MTVAIEEVRQYRERPRDRVETVAASFLGFGFVIWVISLFTIDINDVNDLGFAAAFAPLTWIALFLAITGAVVTIFLIPVAPKRFWRFMIGALLLVIAVIHATPMLLESAPRFFEAYNHVGFIDYIARTGEHSVAVNNRLSWFGAFGAGATLSGTAGPPALFGAIRVFPWLFAMVILFPIHSILSKFIADQRARAAALLFFVLGNWIAQDYFSPQAMAYFMSMTVIALVLHLAPSSGPTVRHMKSWWEARRSPRGPVLVATALTAAIVLGHQLSPVMLIAMVLVLVLAGATSLRAFALVVVAIFLTWFSVGGYFYWGGHIDLLFGVHQEAKQSVSLSTVIAQNITDRLKHGGLEFVVAIARAGTAAIFLAMGTLSVLIGRRSREIRILGVLSIAPFIFLGATGYGGEALMRALFFALPFLSGLAGILLLRVKPRKVAVVVLAIALSFLATMTEVARYGNEKFEQISADQLAIMQSFYEVAPVDSKILYFGNAMPLYFTNIADYTTNYMCYFHFGHAGPKGKYADQDILRQTGIYAPDIIVWTPEAAQFSSHVYHLKKGWDKPLLKYLTAEGRGTLVVNRPDIKIISFDPSWKPKPGVFLSHE